MKEKNEMKQYTSWLFLWIFRFAFSVGAWLPPVDKIKFCRFSPQLVFLMEEKLSLFVTLLVKFKFVSNMNVIRLVTLGFHWNFCYFSGFEAVGIAVFNPAPSLHQECGYHHAGAGCSISCPSLLSLIYFYLMNLSHPPQPLYVLK